MRISLRNEVVQLAEGKPLAFRGAHGIYLECTEGMVWLTIEGQLGDFLLAKGERLRIESNSLALVEGLPSGAIRLVSDLSNPLGGSVLSAFRFARNVALIRTGYSLVYIWLNQYSRTKKPGE